MSMDDIEWRRSIYLGAGLSFVVAAILLFFVTPPFKKDIIPGSEWILIGIQLLITAIIVVIGYFNKREGCLTRIVLMIVGIGVIILGLLGFVAPAIETEMTSLWKSATRICAIVEMIIAFIAFRACI